MSFLNASGPESASGRALDHVLGMEEDLRRVRSMLRMLLVLDLHDVCSDDRDAHAILELAFVANEALGRVTEAHKAACDELRPVGHAGPRQVEVAA